VWVNIRWKTRVRLQRNSTFGLLAAGFAGLDDVDLFGEDGDVTATGGASKARGDDVAADLFVGNACLQGHASGDAAHGAGRGAGALRLLLGRALLRADADSATVIEHAALFCFAEGA